MLKALPFLATGFVLGLLTHAWLAPSAPAPDPGAEEARRKLQQLAEVDLEEYRRLRSQEERYQKADELLGKMMGILLTDLGLRVREAPSEVRAAPVVEAPAASAAPIPKPASPPRREAAPAASLGTHRSTGEGGLLSARDEGEAGALLRASRIENLEEALKTSTAFSNRQGVLQHLTGRFAGPAQVSFAGALRTWEIDLTLNAAMSAGQLDGSLRLALSENGQVFSETKNAGAISALRELGGASRALLVRAEENTYLQAYYLADLDQLAVNLYKRRSEAERFALVGSALLRRH